MPNLSIPLYDQHAPLSARLKEYAKQTGRHQTEIAREAIKEYLDRREKPRK